MLNEIDTRRFGLVDIFQVGWNIYRAYLRKIVAIVLVIYSPVYIIAFFRLLLPQQATEYTAPFYSFFGSLGGLALTAALACLVESSILQNECSWGEALRHGLMRFAALSMTGILEFLILIGLTMLLIIPGLIWAGYYIFVVYVVVLRNLRGKAALDYSKRLVSGKWWRVVGVSFIIGVTGVIPYLVLSVVSGIVFLLFGFDRSLIPPIALFLSAILNIIGALFTVMNIIFFLNTDYIRITRTPLATEPRTVA